MIQKGHIKRYNTNTGVGVITSRFRGTDCVIKHQPNLPITTDSIVYYTYSNVKGKRVCERLETYDFSDEL